MRKKLVCLGLALLLVLAVAACGDSGPDVTLDSVDTVKEEIFLHLNGVEKTGKTYYAVVETTDGTSQFFLPLADEIYAEFQDPQVVGAWSPAQYFKPSDLKKAFESGKVTEGARFTFGVENGKLASLEQENFYADSDKTDSFTFWLYTDFSNGGSYEVGSDKIQFHAYEVEVEADHVTGWMSRSPAWTDLSEGLCWLTGLRFGANFTLTDDGRGLIVDWWPDSTLVAGPGDAAPEPGYDFSDLNTLRWFMMDSLWRTILEEHKIVYPPVENVYYTCGGEPLTFTDFAPIPTLTFDDQSPYMGSAFYFAHADVLGDLEAAAFIDQWFIHGETEMESLTFFADGSWELRNPTAEGGLGLVSNMGTYELDRESAILLSEEGDALAAATIDGTGDVLTLVVLDEDSMLLNWYDDLTFQRYSAAAMG